MEQGMPHRLTLADRTQLQLTGVSEVVSFDETVVVLKTGMGLLTVHGQGLKLKNLSLEGGQAAVEGEICALIYEPERKGGNRRRLFG